LADVPGEPATRPWLYGTARRVLANQRRGARRQGHVSAFLAAELQAAAAAYEPIEPGRSVAAEAFRRLPHEQQDLLGLVAWEGLGARELAVVLGCSANAAKIRLHRARRAYRRLLEDGTDQHANRLRLPAKPAAANSSGEEPSL
jgi:RNA polymerase sigma-70 factor (ECF subfamily)